MRAYISCQQANLTSMTVRQSKRRRGAQSPDFKFKVELCPRHWGAWERVMTSLDTFHPPMDRLSQQPTKAHPGRKVFSFILSEEEKYMIKNNKRQNTGTFDKTSLEYNQTKNPNTAVFINHRGLGSLISHSLLLPVTCWRTGTIIYNFPYSLSTHTPPQKTKYLYWIVYREKIGGKGRGQALK